MEHNVLNYPKEDIERFWSKVNIKKDNNSNILLDECMEWTTGCFSDGYGQFWFKRKNMKAHRFCYMCFHGNITSEQLICHTCDNPPCVNPNHLYIGTQQENIQDRVIKNRSAHGDKSGNCKVNYPGAKASRASN